MVSSLDKLYISVLDSLVIFDFQRHWGCFPYFYIILCLGSYDLEGLKLEAIHNTINKLQNSIQLVFSSCSISILLRNCTS